MVFWFYVPHTATGIFSPSQNFSNEDEMLAHAREFIRLAAVGTDEGWKRQVQAVHGYRVEPERGTRTARGISGNEADAIQASARQERREFVNSLMEEKQV